MHGFARGKREGAVHRAEWPEVALTLLNSDHPRSFAAFAAPPRAPFRCLSLRPWRRCVNSCFSSGMPLSPAGGGRLRSKMRIAFDRRGDAGNLVG